jgi:uncharacterized protein (TIGR00725 family)
MPKANLHNTNKHNHDIIKIGVSGTADMGFLDEKAYDLAKNLGREIVEQGAVLTSGATTGFPFWTAMGAKEVGGVSIGFSPAASEREHVETYRLPLDYMDIIMYTGFGYNGRDLLFTRSSDAILVGPGRVGTFHEFAIAFEDQKPLGILQGGDLWETDKIIKEIVVNSHRTNPNVIFDTDPKRLVKRLIELAKENKKKLLTYGASGAERIL